MWSRQRELFSSPVCRIQFLTQLLKTLALQLPTCCIMKRLWPFAAICCTCLLYNLLAVSRPPLPIPTSKMAVDCDDFPYETPSGIQTIRVSKTRNLTVYCDIQKDGKWTVFHRREIHKAHEDFDRDWIDYKKGFGNLNGAFWLGNEWLHILTYRRGWKYELKVDMQDIEGARLYALYDYFRIDSESYKYRIHLGSYTGTAGDSLSFINNMTFSTGDQDNDLHTDHNCANHDGPFWHRNCGFTYLNIKHVANMHWLRKAGNANLYLQNAQMKIRPFKRPRYAKRR